jgi:oxygen-independent coproporphyrinogen-3 oxidase
MDWTPEAEEAIKQAPPFVRKMARKAVESFAGSRGLAVVTLEIVNEAQQTMMGRTVQRSAQLNKGTGRRQSMHLADEHRFLANATGDPLHDAFDRKLAVHAMARNTAIASEQLPIAWDALMAASPARRQPRSIYIHIPFCQTRCLFCGFYQNPYDEAAARRYVDALLTEMAGTASYPFVQAAPFQTVYFGGGTPTALPAADIHRLVEAVKRLFPLANDCEITLEGRFLHFGPDKIEAALEAGVNRFSLGVQTFNSRIRKSLGRWASEKDLIERLSIFRDLGCAVVVIDLIYGLPGQTLEIWEKDIDTYLDLGVDGCDLYQLNIFSGGPLDAAVEKGRLPKPVSIREQADYYQRGVEMMKAAHQRRLSNSHWAESTRERSMYNAISRGRSECIPLGSGAGGWVGGSMFFNEGDLTAYIDAVAAGRKPLAMGYAGDGDGPLYRDIASQMELGYCNLQDLGARHGRDLFRMLGPVVNQWEEAGLIRTDSGCLSLTLAGEFWAVNLAQILIDILQMQ